MALAIRWYEKSYPGEMVYADTKLLPRPQGETKEVPRERLYIATDDFSRFLVPDILPDKSQGSSAVFAGRLRPSKQIPFAIKDWYYDPPSCRLVKRIHDIER